MDKNAYQAGEVAQIHVEVQNNSTVEMEGFNSSLIRNIGFRTSDGRSKDMTDVISKQRYPGCAPKSRVSRDIPLPLTAADGMLSATTKSRLIECKYVVEIEVAIPWAPDIELYLPVTIYVPGAGAIPVAAPPAWTQQAVAQAHAPAQPIAVAIPANQAVRELAPPPYAAAGPVEPSAPPAGAAYGAV